MKSSLFVASLCVLLLGACKNPGPPRSPQAESWTSPDFAGAKLLDIAVLPPSLPENGRPAYAEVMRDAARAQLIRAKGYAAPAPSFIDERAQGAAGAAAATAVGSDAALQISIQKIDTTEFLGRGRLWVSGRLSLVAAGGELWRTTFSDHMEIASGDPDAITFEAAVAETLGTIARQKLVSLPPKPSVAR